MSYEDSVPKLDTVDSTAIGIAPRVIVLSKTYMIMIAYAYRVRLLRGATFETSAYKWHHGGFKFIWDTP